MSVTKAPQLEALKSMSLPPLSADGKPQPKLSAISRQYDVGNKGFLSDAEMQMREMDSENRGYLTNAQVAQVVEQTMTIREANMTLRNYLIG